MGLGKPGWLEIKWYTSIVIYADDNIQGGGVHTTRRNTEAFIVAGKEIGLKVNADETKYIVMSRNQNVGQSHRTKSDNSSFESVEEFKYLRTTLRKQNSIQE
jgi:hypothetical protein